MINVCEINMCTGCMSCINVCKKNAITIKDDIDSYNAEINETLCGNCGACYQVCQQNQDVPTYTPKFWNQGWASNQSIRDKSSSGGLGAVLIKNFLELYGVVCTCKFYNGRFIYDFVDSVNDIEMFIGSKYVKSSPEGIYIKIKEYLKSGIKVLFIGLPCHVAAIKIFCGEKLLENLYTVDLICHGTPSPKLLEQFLEEYKISINKIRFIKFRKKNHFHIYLDENIILPERVIDMYTFAFLEGLDYTENCYSCKYARLERVSDITIGDSWGTNLHSEEKKGISLILCQTVKGKKLIEELDVDLKQVDLQNAIASNHQLSYPSNKTNKRNKFMRLIKKGFTFKLAVANCYPLMYFKQEIKLILIKLKILLEI